MAKLKRGDGETTPDDTAVQKHFLILLCLFNGLLIADMFEGLDDDAVVEAVEAAEEAKDSATVVAALSHCCAEPDDFAAAAEAAGDAINRLATEGKLSDAAPAVSPADVYAKYIGGRGIAGV